MCRIGAPGTPHLGTSLDTPQVSAGPSLCEGSPQTKVGSRERIGIAKRSHRNIRDCPGSHSWKLLQACDGLLSIGSAIEYEFLLGDRAGKGLQRLDAPIRQSQSLEICRRYNMGKWKKMGEGPLWLLEWHATGGDQPTDEGSRACH